MSLSELISHPMGRLRIALVAVFLLLAGGTFGYVVIEHMTILDGLYMTIITLSSVGFEEVKPLDPAGRLFTIMLIAFGVTAAGFIVTALGHLIIDGELRGIVAQKRMARKVAKMQDHIIVAGFGRVGRQVARELNRCSAQFVVIERAGEQQEREAGDLHIYGDASNEDILTRAGIDRAKTLISTIPDEAQNVYLTLTARTMNPKLNIIARADFEEGEKKLKRAGANHVIIPHLLGGTHMATAALRPHEVDYLPKSVLGAEGLRVEEVIVRPGSSLAGKTISQLLAACGPRLSVIAVKSGGEVMIVRPADTAILQAGDVVILLGDHRQLERLVPEFS